MKIQKLFSTTFILLLVFILAACNLPGGAPLGGPTPTPTRLGGSSPDDGGSGSPGGGTGSGSGSCANPLWPVVSGAYWSYESNDSVLGQYTFTSTVTEVGIDGFGLTNEYSTGVTASQAWQCQTGNLISLSVGGGTAATLSTNNGTNAQTQTTGNSGMTLPALVTAGNAWSQTMNLSGTVTLTDGNSGSSEGTYVADFSAVGVESVSVPAGTFDAIAHRNDQRLHPQHHRGGHDRPHGGQQRRHALVRAWSRVGDAGQHQRHHGHGDDHVDRIQRTLTTSE